MAVGAEIVTLGKYGALTILYLPSRDAFYFASPSALLSQDCPDQTVFVGQFIVDHDSTPRILVFDLSRYQGVSLMDMPNTERYACLQQLGQHLGPLCTVQWVGNTDTLAAELKSGKFQVPHPVKGVMALGAPGKVNLRAIT